MWKRTKDLKRDCDPPKRWTPANKEKGITKGYCEEKTGSAPLVEQVSVKDRVSPKISIPPLVRVSPKVGLPHHVEIPSSIEIPPVVGYQKTKDLMRDCNPPKRWTPSNKAKGIPKGFCEEPVNTRPVSTQPANTGHVSDKHKPVVQPIELTTVHTIPIFSEDEKKEQIPIVPHILKNSIESSENLMMQLQYIASVNSSLPECPSNYSYENALTHVLQLSAYYKKFHNIVDDADMQLFLQCFVQDIFRRAQDQIYIDGSGTNAFHVLSQDVKRYLQLLRIKTRSSYGTAYLTYAKDAPTIPFAITKVVKVTKTKLTPTTKYSEILHEIAIGYVLNTLRQSVPTFMYMYGGFYCNSLPTTNSKSRSDMVCDERDPARMSVLSMQECIQNALPFDEIVNKHIHEKDLSRVSIEVLLQVAHALYLAQSNFQYMHFDLHGGNVLITKLDVPTTIHLVSDKYDRTLHNVQYIPHIIDYGQNSCTYRGQFFTSLHGKGHITDKMWMYELGSCKDEYYFPGFDIYRYLTFVLSVAYKYLLSDQFLKMRDAMVALFLSDVPRAKHAKLFEDFFTTMNTQEWSDLLKKEEIKLDFCMAVDRYLFTKDAGDWIQSIAGDLV